MPGPRTILVVDDDPVVLRSLQAILEDDFDVIACSAGAPAVDFVTENPGRVAAAFIDFVMPELDGNAVCAALRSLDPTISIVGFSATDDAPFTGRLFQQLQKKEMVVETVLRVAKDAVARTDELRNA